MAAGKVRTHADETAGQGDHQRFAENQNGDVFRAEAQCFHDRVIAGAFARGHGHGIGDNGHDDDDDDKRHHLNGRDNGFAHGDKAEIESLFRFRQCFRQRIFKDFINGHEPYPAAMSGRDTPIM